MGHANPHALDRGDRLGRDRCRVRQQEPFVGAHDDLGDHIDHRHHAHDRELDADERQPVDDDGRARGLALPDQSAHRDVGGGQRGRREHLFHARLSEPGYRRLLPERLSGRLLRDRLGGDAGGRSGQPGRHSRRHPAKRAPRSREVRPRHPAEVNVGNFPAATCTPTPVLGLRIYPPNQTAAAFIPQTGTGCAQSGVDQLQIGFVVNGAG